MYECTQLGGVSVNISEDNMVNICEYPCMSVPSWVGVQ